MAGAAAAQERKEVCHASDYGVSRGCGVERNGIGRRGTFHGGAAAGSHGGTGGYRGRGPAVGGADRGGPLRRDEVDGDRRPDQGPERAGRRRGPQNRARRDHFALQPHRGFRRWRGRRGVHPRHGLEPAGRRDPDAHRRRARLQSPVEPRAPRPQSHQRGSGDRGIQGGSARGVRQRFRGHQHGPEAPHERGFRNRAPWGVRELQHLCRNRRARRKNRAAGLLRRTGAAEVRRPPPPCRRTALRFPPGRRIRVVG